MNRLADSQASLAKWAKLGQQQRSTKQESLPSWSPARKMIDAARPAFRENKATAQRLLALSNQYLAPLKDPFETDLGLHRWLNGEREEAYSDWLAWIIEQLATPEKIIPLFCGQSAADLVAQCTGPLKVQRETVFETTESVRRTDIEICFGYKKAILVEVKLVDADEVADEQLLDQGHYGKDFEKRVLLVASGEPNASAEDFTLILWRDICLRLRRLTPSICGENISVAALVLAFVGAVEQNVLNLLPKSEWHFVTSGGAGTFNRVNGGMSSA